MAMTVRAVHLRTRELVKTLGVSEVVVHRLKTPASSPKSQRVFHPFPQNSGHKHPCCLGGTAEAFAVNRGAFQLFRLQLDVFVLHGLSANKDV